MDIKFNKRESYKKKPWQSVDYQGFIVPQAGLEPAHSEEFQILSLNFLLLFKVN